MRSDSRKIIDDINLKIEQLYRVHFYNKRTRKTVKLQNNNFDIDTEYKEIVVPYWKKYGIKPNKKYFQLYCYKDKKVNPRYIPDDIWYGKILPYYSNSLFRRYGEDKGQHYLYFSDIKRPTMLAKNIADVFYDSKMQVIRNVDDVVKLCLESEGEFLIKPSIDSGKGRLITFIRPEDTSKEELKEILLEFKSNYVIQKVIKQHYALNQLSENSVNTIRTLSFFLDGEVHILSSRVRFSKGDARVDNVGMGSGVSCKIDENGFLNNWVSDVLFNTWSEEELGIKLSQIQVPGFAKIQDIIKEKHKLLPHFKIIGWDFAINQNGEPVLIEFNTHPAMNQTVCGPTFGDLTEIVLEDVFINKSLKYAQN